LPDDVVERLSSWQLTRKREAAVECHGKNARDWLGSACQEQQHA